jgi:MFS family permease
MTWKRTWPFWVIAGGYVVTMLGTTLPTPLYPLYARRYGISALGLTAIFAAYGFTVIIVLLGFGPRADHFRRRWVLLLALVLTGLSALDFTVASSEVALFVGRVLSGVAAGLYAAEGAAALTELHPARDTRVAALASTAASMAGLGLGPLLAGVLAQYAPDPLRLAYAVQLALVAVSLVAVWTVPEPERPQPSPPGPREREAVGAGVRGVGVPDALRPVFVRAATVALCGFALMGLFTSLVPSMLSAELHTQNHALAGATAALVFAASAVAQLALRRLPDRASISAGAVLVAAALAVVVAAAFSGMVVLLLSGALIGGLGQGLSFMGSMAVVNRQAPDTFRGSVVSAYFVAAYLGIAMPVLGLGVLAAPLGFATATLVFAAVLAPLALLVAVDAIRPAAARAYGSPTPCSEQPHPAVQPC